MDSIARGACTYIFVWLILRISGKRTLSEATAFDFVLLLIISETLQSALNQNDNSLTNSFLIIVTLVGLDIIASHLSFRFPRVNHLLNSKAQIIVDNGKPNRESMKRQRIDIEDILAAARELQGIDSLDKIRYAILETNGRISIIPH